MAKFTVIKREDAKSATFKGFLNSPYHIIYNILGEPYGLSEDGNIKCEWCIQLEDGTIIRVYDWKSIQDPLKRRDWNIGGSDSTAFEKIYKLLGNYTVMPPPPALP